MGQAPQRGHFSKSVSVSIMALAPLGEPHGCERLELAQVPASAPFASLDDVNLGPGRICPNQRFLFPLWVCIEAPATLP
jgi:hypothetical protein